ncbi:MAG: glycine zipper 2TM domain-containing protein [Sphingomonas sp.]|uniref:glycine zipper 2TM domain-containing protein n=1 Tax=Sphingomonas sp. TaxID=28214 RepID=UPI0025EEA1D6|nr:glycine zipper 2TM domain-containing protein [Sphingomonas sp.]MBX9858643.1 glycine zipper 2TM domain-containing protein [Sphingomonas sp.]MBY0282662.1 glycine zipper 2TM domain-containing protein [Sphingomonas sp.]
MRNLLMVIAAAGLIVPPAAMSFPTKAEAKEKKHRAYTYRRGGRTYCRHSDGTTGLIVGGVGGAVVGNSVDNGGLLGTALGAVGGAFAGRAVDRTLTANKRCR